ncbi:MAG: DUF1048 domain-containing protein [Bacilli bacterium]
MRFLDKITGKDMNKKMDDFEKRVSKLPSDYQICFKEVKNNLWLHSDFTGRNLMNVFEEVVSMFEEASQYSNVGLLLDTSVEEFCRELMGDDVNTYQDKCKRKLNKNIRKKLGE